MLEIAQGTDELLEVIVTDKDSNFIDLTAVTILRVYATVRLGRHEKFKFATNLTGLASYELCSIDGTTSHKLLIPLNRDKTRTLDTGTLNIDVSIDYSDVSFADGIRREEFQFQKIAEVIKGSSRLIS